MNFTDPQEISLSLTNDKEVILSIQMDDKASYQRYDQVKRTNEVKVGTDDLDLAGGDYYTTSGNCIINFTSSRVNFPNKPLHSLFKKMTN